MATHRFPTDMGDLADKTFEEVFKQCPKTVEFAVQLWNDEQTSGLFLEFLLFCRNMLENPAVRHEHEMRTQKLVNSLKPIDIPCYLQKYKDNKLNDAACL